MEYLGRASQLCIYISGVYLGVRHRRPRHREESKRWRARPPSPRQVCILHLGGQRAERTGGGARRPGGDGVGGGDRMDAVEEVRALGHGECELWRRWGGLADGGKRSRATWMIGRGGAARVPRGRAWSNIHAAGFFCLTSTLFARSPTESSADRLIRCDERSEVTSAALRQSGYRTPSASSDCPARVTIGPTSGTHPPSAISARASFGSHVCVSGVRPAGSEHISDCGQHITWRTRESRGGRSSASAGGTRAYDNEMYVDVRGRERGRGAGGARAMGRCSGCA